MTYVCPATAGSTRCILMLSKTAISLFMAVYVTRRGNRSAAALSFSCE